MSAQLPVNNDTGLEVLDHLVPPLEKGGFLQYRLRMRGALHGLSAPYDETRQPVYECRPADWRTAAYPPRAALQACGEDASLTSKVEFIMES